MNEDCSSRILLYKVYVTEKNSPKVLQKYSTSTAPHKRITTRKNLGTMSSMPHKKDAQEWYVLTEEKLDGTGIQQ